MDSIVPTKILYVDDLHENLFSFKALFSDKFNLIFATSGQRGLELIEKEQIEIVISDISLPEMTGIEFLKIVKKKYPEVKRILLTSCDDSKVENEVINECEVFRFLNKPFNIPEITKVLNQALEGNNKRLINHYIQKS